MEYAKSKFYVALSAEITPDGALNILDRLAHDEGLRQRIRDAPRDTFLNELGVDIGEDLAPSEAVLPEPEEIEKALESFRTEREMHFECVPFGHFIPGKAPFKATLLLAAKANQGG